MSDGVPVLSMETRSSDDESFLYLDCEGSTKTASFYLMLPPGAFDKGFMVEFLDTEGAVMFKSAKADVNTVLRSSILDMPISIYQPAFQAAFFEHASFGFFPAVGASETLDALMHLSTRLIPFLSPVPPFQSYMRWASSNKEHASALDGAPLRERGCLNRLDIAFFL